MEFLTFLNAREIEILELLYKADYSVEENTPLCLIGEEFVGFLKRRQRKVVICTDNAKKRGGYFITKLRPNDELDRTGIYIRRALRHESIHIAQDCNNGNTVDLIEKKKLKIHPYKTEALEGSVSVSGNREKEYEAYALEDKPKYVIKALKKYCF